MGTDGIGGSDGPGVGRRICLLANRRASRAERVLPDLPRILDAIGLDVSLEVPDSPGDIPDRIRALARDPSSPCEAVVVAGGDGTLHHALPSVLEAGLPLGILPLGTANDLARGLGLPLDPEKALRAIASGRTRRIDLGRANDHCFLNVASAGISGHVTRGLDEEEKRRWGVLSYPKQLLSALRRMRPFRVELTVDGRTEQFRALQVSVANGPSFGGGASIDQDVRIDDGQLAVCVIESVSAWRLARLLPLLWLGRARWGEAAWVREGAEISVATSRSLEISADGEIATRTPAEFRVEPGVLEVFVGEEGP